MDVLKKMWSFFWCSSVEKKKSRVSWDANLEIAPEAKKKHNQVDWKALQFILEPGKIMKTKKKRKNKKNKAARHRAKEMKLRGLEDETIKEAMKRKVKVLEEMLKKPGLLKGGGPKRVQQSLNRWMQPKEEQEETAGIPEDVGAALPVQVDAAIPEQVDATTEAINEEACGAGMLELCKLHPRLCKMHSFMSQAVDLYQSSGAPCPGKPESDVCPMQDTPMKTEMKTECSSNVMPDNASDAGSVESKCKQVDAKELGRKGAEARKETLRLRKLAGVKTTYRKPLSLEQQITVVQYVVKNKPESFSNSIQEGNWWKEAAAILEMPKDQMKHAWKNRVTVNSTYNEVVKNLKESTWRNKFAKKRYEARRLQRFRGPGAGRKQQFQDLLDTLQIKIKTEEKMYGHNLHPDDIVWMWRESLSEEAVNLLKLKVEKEKESLELDKVMKKRLESVCKRLEQFGDSKSASQQKGDLMHNIGRTKVMVARKTELSPAEEKIRMKLTWQDFDCTMHMCTLDEAELAHHVCKPKEFMQNLDKFCLLFEDEVGVWVGMQNNKVAVDKAEHAQAKKRYKLHSKTVEGMQKIAELEKEAGGGMKQQRGVEGKGEDKRRITFLHRLVLDNVVQGEGKRLKPQGRLERTVLVFPGKHANADYFDFDESGAAVWNRDWDYEYEGKSVQHKKGEKLGNMMGQLQQCKRAFPHLLKRFLVMQQPAAFRDGITNGWCMEDLHQREKYVMVQHDLVGSQATAEVKQLRWAYMQPDSTIAGEMTACSQVTDIMIAHVVKSIARKEMPRIRQWLKQKARRQGKEVKYALGPLEILMIAEAIDKGLEKWLKEYDFVFHGARQGGHLAYLPDVDVKKLVPVEEAAEHWPAPIVPEGMDPCKAPPKVPKLGGGKLDAEWLHDRLDWMQNGKPLKPDWKEMDIHGPGELHKTFNPDDDKCIEVPLETEYADGKVTKEEQEIFDAHFAQLQDHPAIRQAVFMEMYERLEGTKKKSKTLKKAMVKNPTQQKSYKIKRAKMQANFAWRLQAAQYLSEGYTAEDIASRVVLKARCKKPKLAKNGNNQMKMKTVTGAICLKAVSQKVKHLQKQKKQLAATAKIISELGPMVGKKVKLKKDCVLDVFPTPTPPKLF